METFKPYLDTLAALANVFTIAASVVGFYVFFASRRKVSAALQFLLNYSFQTTLGELKDKLERLNEYNANEPDDLPEIRNILHEIAGQIRGNSRLLRGAPHMPGRIEEFARSKRLLEPSKRSLVSELREVFRNIHAQSTASETDTQDE